MHIILYVEAFVSFVFHEALEIFITSKIDSLMGNIAFDLETLTFEMVKNMFSTSHVDKLLRL